MNGSRPKSSATAGSDLVAVVGIGPRFAGLLIDKGIGSLQDLARLNPEDVARLDADDRIRGRAGRENWVGQARELLG